MSVNRMSDYGNVVLSKYRIIEKSIHRVWDYRNVGLSVVGLSKCGFIGSGIIAA